MEMKFNPVGWFEIPVDDMERAMKFYEAILGYKLDLQPEMEGMLMAWFPMERGLEGATGALVKHEMCKPNPTGTVVYFNSPSGNLSNELSKAEEIGAQVLVPKKDIGEHGFIAMLKDSEGNTIALHSME